MAIFAALLLFLTGFVASSSGEAAPLVVGGKGRPGVEINERLVYGAGSGLRTITKEPVITLDHSPDKDPVIAHQGLSPGAPSLPVISPIPDDPQPVISSLDDAVSTTQSMPLTETEPLSKTGIPGAGVAETATETLLKNQVPKNQVSEKKSSAKKKRKDKKENKAKKDKKIKKDNVKEKDSVKDSVISGQDMTAPGEPEALATILPSRTEIETEPEIETLAAKQSLNQETTDQESIDQARNQEKGPLPSLPVEEPLDTPDQSDKPLTGDSGIADMKMQEELVPPPLPDLDMDNGFRVSILDVLQDMPASSEEMAENREQYPSSSPELKAEPVDIVLSPDKQTSPREDSSEPLSEDQNASDSSDASDLSDSPEPVDMAALPVPLQPSSGEDGSENRGAISVAFAADSAVLDDEARQIIQNIARRLAANPTMRVQILSFAGSKEDNPSKARRLSLSRGVTLRSQLMEEGVRREQMDVKALGEGYGDGPQDRADLVILSP